MKAVGVNPLHATFDIADAKVIAPGHPERSVLFARMTRRGPGQMPQLATAIVDEQAVAVIREWIESLEPRPDAVSTTYRNTTRSSAGSAAWTRPSFQDSRP
jgi:hypothetical protein